MTLELPGIDDLDFATLVEEAKARIPVHNPDWTNYNDSDPGITLLQLFAFMTDSLLYRANRIPERNRRKFLRLLGLQQRPAVPARGIVVFDATKGPLAAHVVRQDTELRAGPLPFLTERTVDVLPVRAVVCAKLPSTVQLDEQERQAYLSMYGDLDPLADDVQLYETRRLDVPAGGARYRPVQLAATVDQSLWVALLAPDPELVDDVRDLVGGRVLTLGVLPDVVDARRTLDPASVQRREAPARLVVAAPVGGPLPPEPQPRVPQYRELDVVEHGDVLVEPGVVAVTLPPPDELVLWDDLDPVDEGFGAFPPPLEPDERARVVTWLRIRRPVGDEHRTLLGASFAWVGINAVPVAQLGRVADERLPNGTGEVDQTVRLAHGSVLGDTVGVVVDGVPWTRTDDLRAAAPETAVGTGAAAAGSPHVFECEPDGTVRFGSGLHGARPPRGATIRASYAHGGGRGGVLPAGGITTGTGLPPGVTVTNPVGTWGGADAESMEDAEARMSATVRHRERAVTADDVREITWRTPGVDLARVEVLPLLHPQLVDVESPGVISVLVVPAFDPAQPDAPRPDAMFLDAVCEHLDARRLVTTEVHVRGPEYVGIAVSVGFEPAPGRDVPAVREAVQARVRAFLSPLDLVPGDGHGGWPLGKAVDPLEILTEVARVEGVAKVNGVRLATADGTARTSPLPLSGLELPRLVALRTSPGDPPPAGEPVGSGGSDGSGPTRLLPVPTIPEEC